jgi:hypothetical protein
MLRICWLGNLRERSCEGLRADERVGDVDSESYRCYGTEKWLRQDRFIAFVDHAQTIKLAHPLFSLIFTILTVWYQRKMYLY